MNYLNNPVLWKWLFVIAIGLLVVENSICSGETSPSKSMTKEEKENLR